MGKQLLNACTTFAAAVAAAFAVPDACAAQLARFAFTGAAGAATVSSLAVVNGTLNLPPNLDHEPFTATVGTERAGGYSLTAELPVWRKMSARVAGAAVRTRLRADARLVSDPSFQIGIRDAGRVTVWSVGADALVPLLHWRSLAFYAAAGGGVQHWQIRQLDSLVVVPSEGIIASIRPVDATTVMGTIAAGVNVRLGRSAALRVELHDQVAADPLSDQDFTFSGVIAGTALPANAVHTVRGTLGLCVLIGNAR